MLSLTNMTKAIAPVNKIIHTSSVDGPGNRSAIFLQGCNIHCKYCHNPETQSMCISCADCIPGCPTGAIKINGDKISYDYLKCVNCDACINICKNLSSPKIRYMDAESVFNEIKKNIPYIRGITVSGGECMLNPDFIYELFAIAHNNNLTTLIDSNGTIDFKNYPDLLNVCDGVMLDIKAFDEDDFFNVTGHTGKIVLENALYLGEINKLHEVRFVIVPDLFDAKKTITGASKFLLDTYNKNPFTIKLIKFRPFGVVDEFKSMRTPSDSEMDELKQIFTDLGYERIVIC